MIIINLAILHEFLENSQRFQIKLANLIHYITHVLQRYKHGKNVDFCLVNLKI